MRPATARPERPQKLHATESAGVIPIHVSNVVVPPCTSSMQQTLSRSVALAIVSSKRSVPFRSLISRPPLRSRRAYGGRRSELRAPSAGVIGQPVCAVPAAEANQPDAKR